MAQRGDFAVNPSRFALRERIHLHDRAIGLISEIVPDAIEFVNGVQRFFRRIGHPPTIARWQSQFFSQGKRSECFSSSAPSITPVP